MNMRNLWIKIELSEPRYPNIEYSESNLGLFVAITRSDTRLVWREGNSVEYFTHQASIYPEGHGDEYTCCCLPLIMRLAHYIGLIRSLYRFSSKLYMQKICPFSVSGRTIGSWYIDNHFEQNKVDAVKQTTCEMAYSDFPHTHHEATCRS